MNAVFVTGEGDDVRVERDEITRTEVVRERLLVRRDDVPWLADELDRYLADRGFHEEEVDRGGVIYVLAPGGTDWEPGINLLGRTPDGASRGSVFLPDADLPAVVAALRDLGPGRIVVDPDDTATWTRLLRDDRERYLRERAALGRARISLRGADLAGLDLTALDLADLTDANLDGATVRVTGLSTCRLQRAGLRGIVSDHPAVGLDRIRQIEALWAGGAAWNALRRERRPEMMVHADFADHDLEDADLSGVLFARAALAGANLSRCVLHDVTFDRADLRGAVLAGARIDRCRFEEARLDGADLDGARIEHGRFGRASLVGASFRRADLYNCVFWEADASGARFDGARLEQCPGLPTSATG